MRKRKTNEQFFTENPKAMSVEQFKALVDFLKNNKNPVSKRRMIPYANKLITAISEINDDETLTQINTVLRDCHNGLCMSIDDCGLCLKITEKINSQRKKILSQ